MNTTALFDIGARFVSADRARLAAERVRQDAGLRPSQVEILDQDMPRSGKLRSTASFRTWLAIRRWHVVLGLAGLVLGTAGGALLTATGPALFDRLPTATMALGGFFGAIFGMLIAGAVSLRPDKGWLQARAMDDAREGYNVVLVHATAPDQAEAARQLLESSGGEAYAAPDARMALRAGSPSGPGRAGGPAMKTEEEATMSNEKVKPTGGEGDRQSDRRYREKTREFVEEHGERATEADRPRDDRDAARIERAEDRARSRAKEKDPNVVRDYSEESR